MTAASLPSPPPRWSVSDTASLVARIVIGALFIYMGINKALHPVEFLKLVRQYDVLHHHMALNLVAATLPWFEILCGLLLVLGVAVRGTALMLVAMLAAFTILIFLRAVALQKVGELAFCAIKFDCGCGAGEVFVCRKLAENVLLLALSTWLMLRPASRLSLRHSLA